MKYLCTSALEHQTPVTLAPCSKGFFYPPKSGDTGEAAHAPRTQTRRENGMTAPPEMLLPPSRQTAGTARLRPVAAGGTRRTERRRRAADPAAGAQLGVTVPGRKPGEARPRVAGRLPPSFPPSSGRRRHRSLPGPHTTEGCSPGLLGGAQTKEGNVDEPGRDGSSPGSPGQARPPHPSSLSRSQLREQAK